LWVCHDGAPLRQPGLEPREAGNARQSFLGGEVLEESVLLDGLSLRIDDTLNVVRAQRGVLDQQLRDDLLRLDQCQPSEVVDESHPILCGQLDAHRHARRLVTDHPLEHDAIVLEHRAAQLERRGVGPECVGEAHILAGDDQRTAFRAERRHEVEHVTRNERILQERSKLAKKEDASAFALGAGQCLVRLLRILAMRLARGGAT
jgi:hypothetical protein